MPTETPNCTDCRLGAFTIYAPTFLQSPKKICARRVEVRTFKAHQIVLREGETPQHVFTLQSGWACRYVQIEGGRRQILAVLIPGDVVTAEVVCAPDTNIRSSVRTLTQATLCAFSADTMHELVQSNASQREAFAAFILAESNRADRRLTDIGQRRAIGRLAQLMLELETRLHTRGLTRHDGFEFPLRQDDLADALGLTPAHVNRTLVQLRRNGAIELAQGRLRVLDRNTLRAIAVEE